LPRGESNFTHDHLDFKNVPGEKHPDPYLQGQGREKERMGRDYRVHTSKGSAEGKDRGGAIRMGQRQGGSCSKVLRGG